MKSESASQGSLKPVHAFMVAIAIVVVPCGFAYFEVDRLGRLERELVEREKELNERELRLSKLFDSIVSQQTYLSVQRVNLSKGSSGRGRTIFQMLGHNSFSVPASRFVVVKSPQGVGAFAFFQESHADDTAVRAYSWYFRKTGSGPFEKSVGTSHGIGKVFERYKVIRKNEDGSNLVENDGGQLYVRCGPIRIEWSQGDYIYLNTGKPIKIAFSGKKDIEQVDPDDPSLIWYSARAANTSTMLGRHRMSKLDTSPTMNRAELTKALNENLGEFIDLNQLESKSDGRKIRPERK